MLSTEELSFCIVWALFLTTANKNRYVIGTGTVALAATSDLFKENVGILRSSRHRSRRKYRSQLLRVQVIIRSGGRRWYADFKNNQCSSLPIIGIGDAAISLLVRKGLSRNRHVDPIERCQCTLLSDAYAICPPHPAGRRSCYSCKESLCFDVIAIPKIQTFIFFVVV
ncbi:hypothetical protein BDR07DRAFT_879011 [Suillus spraguei]|nr:hypothetical protein BDR07DRAFT_879011 [Suillus spraguei]